MTRSKTSPKATARRRAEPGPCCVVDGGCLAPANSIQACWVRTECFACGENVCTNCSSIRQYHGFGRRRLCNNCQVDYDGDQAQVMLTMYHRAGYPHMTLAKVREQLAQEATLIKESEAREELRRASQRKAQSSPCRT